MTRVPPHNLTAEESVLGAMLLRREPIAVASERLTTDSFYKPAHQHIYDTILKLDANGQPADPVTVADALGCSGLLASVGGPAVLVNLVANVPATNAEHVARYATIVENHAIARRIIGSAGDIAEIGYEAATDPAAALDRVESTVLRLSQKRSGGDTTTGHVDDLLDLTLSRLEELFEQGQTVTGIPTGFTDLDDLLGGLQPHALYVIGGRPSMGKTSLGLDIARHAALQAQIPVLVFSLEMGRVEVTKRMLCSESRIDSKRLRTGNLSPNDWSKVAEATERMAGAPLWIDDNPFATVSEIRSKARKLTAAHGKIGLVIVDYLQLMSAQSASGNRVAEVTEISRGLKLLARELECPVVAMSQLSRGLENRADRRPMLADLRESGSVEQDADVVMFIYRDEVYNPESPDRGIAEVNVAKHRDGATATVRLAFLDHYTKFANMSRKAA